VCTRFGVVLGKEGGALAKMLTPFRLGLGGSLGSGRQWMSWIHRDDLVSLILWAASGDVKGPVNAVAPVPVRNSDFSRALGVALRRPAVLRVPEVALKVVFGEMASVLLGSSRVAPETAQRYGFRWQFDSLEAALADAVVD